ncbi:protein ROOT INITIATION DEFECTIVE 3 [Telopea speciosissima]|uniref:protein ROOT INITIATION DEFECTIVE 3 n=1 Tax=Telopea speciosissima TaxID=54955 RepID=UPI001CC7DF76|nr:protein ROOT INITIATION DEFECTIVE 3 [Telopea speciosissima]
MEVVIASSPVDAGIGCWDLHSGEQQLRYRSCASASHGLTCVGRRFLASSQLRDSSSSSGSILYWSWNKPQVEVKSFPAEPINPLVSNSEGTYIMGGGLSGDIYFWEVSSGRLLKRWRAHYRAVTCLVLSEDDSLLISGSEDGCVRVWSLIMIFDDIGREAAKHLYLHSFTEHTLRVTAVVSGYGGCNAIIVSGSEDRTCKVWSMSKGKLLRSIEFPSVIDAIALDPGEHVFYAGSRDGKIFIAALGAESPSNSSYGKHIIGLLSDHSKAVTCLAFSSNGTLLVSGSEDGLIRVWDTKTQNIVRIFKHAKGPVNNVLIVRQPFIGISRKVGSAQAPLSRRAASLLPPPLDKYAYSSDENNEPKAVIAPQPSCDESLDAPYHSFHVMKNQINELQQQGSSAATEMELERMKLDLKRSLEMVERWKKMFEDLKHFCVNELVEGDQTGRPSGNST